MTSNGNQFAIFRIKKLRTPEEISKVGNHNDRRGLLPANVDRSRVELNRSYIKDDRSLLDRVRAKLDGKKYRHDAVKAVEIVCGFSPGCEKFILVEEWAKASIDFIKRTFGAENLVSAVLHLDEKTPHLQCVIVPLIGEKLAAKRIFGTRQKMRELQTCYHEAVKKFGLIRGTKGSSRPHLSMQEIYQGTQEGAELVKKTLDTIPKKSPLETWKTYSEKLREHITTALKPLAAAKTAATLAALEVQSLRRLVEESESARKAVAYRLRSLNLVEVAARLLGYEGAKKGKSVIFEDDARKIIIIGNSFQDEKSTARAERGAISLARHILQVDFETAVKTLTQYFPDQLDDLLAEAIFTTEKKLACDIAESSQKLIDPEIEIQRFASPDASKLPEVRQYLSKVKKIPTALIEHLVTSMSLWANKWGSACFPKTNKQGNLGVATESTTCGTIQSLGAKESFFTIGLINESTNVAIVASPIAALNIYASTGQPAIAVESAALAHCAFEFLRNYGVSKVTLPTSQPGADKRLKSRCKEEADLAGFESTASQQPCLNTSAVQVGTISKETVDKLRKMLKSLDSPEMW